MVDQRPECNLVEGCNKPGVIMVGSYICCEEHILKFVAKQEEMNNKVIAEMMKDA